MSRRQVLSYSDALDAPSGNVDLEAPLPSLDPHQQFHPGSSPYPPPLHWSHQQQPAFPNNAHAGPSRITYGSEGGFGPPPMHLQPYNGNGPSSYQGPPPPFHYAGPPPRLPLNGLPPAFAPHMQSHNGYQHHQYHAEPYHRPPPLQQQPRPPVGPPPAQLDPPPPPIALPTGPKAQRLASSKHDQRVAQDSYGSVPQAYLSPATSMNASRSVSPYSALQSPALLNSTSRYSAWPGNSLRTSVVIEDCDVSSDEDDESDSSDAEEAEDEKSKRRKTSRYMRQRTLLEMTERYRQLNGSINAESTSSPAPEVTEYDRKQAEIKAMMEKIKKLEEAKAQLKSKIKVGGAVVEQSNGKDEQTSSSATKASAPDAVQSDQTDKPAQPLPSISTMDQPPKISPELPQEPIKPSAPSPAPSLEEGEYLEVLPMQATGASLRSDLAEQRQRLLESMKRKKALASVKASSSHPASSDQQEPVAEAEQEIAVNTRKRKADSVDLDLEAIEQHVVQTTPAEQEDQVTNEHEPPADQPSDETSTKRNKRQRKKERRRERERLAAVAAEEQGAVDGTEDDTKPDDTEAADSTTETTASPEKTDSAAPVTTRTRSKKRWCEVEADQGECPDGTCEARHANK